MKLGARIILSGEAARPLTDREVAKMLCGVLGMCASFRTEPQTLKAAAYWVAQNWEAIEPGLRAAAFESAGPVIRGADDQGNA